MRILVLTLMMSFLSQGVFGSAKRQRTGGGEVDRLSSCCELLPVIGGFLDNSDLDTFRQCASSLYQGLLCQSEVSTVLNGLALKSFLVLIILNYESYF